MNNVIMMGRLTRDPEVRYTQSNVAYARFTVAVDRRGSRNNDGGQEQTADFISCVAWRNTAEFIEKYIHKGTKICLNGRIQTGSYTNKDGQKVYTTDVVVDNVEFAESKNASDAGSFDGGNSMPSAPIDGGFMNIPDGVEEELPFN